MPRRSPFSIILSKEERVHGELLICPQFREFSVSCYDAEMRDLVILFIHLITTLARLATREASVP